MKPFLFVVLLAALSACTSPSNNSTAVSPSAAPLDSFCILGSAAEPLTDGMSVYLLDIATNQFLDSTTIENGKFVFSGKQDTAIVRGLFAPKTPNDLFPIYLPVVVENANILARLGQNVGIGGTPLNEKMMDFVIALADMQDRMLASSKPLEQSNADFQAFITEQIALNANTLVGQYIATSYPPKEQ